MPARDAVGRAGCQREDAACRRRHMVIEPWGRCTTSSRFRKAPSKRGARPFGWLISWLLLDPRWPVRSTTRCAVDRLLERRGTGLLVASRT